MNENIQTTLLKLVSNPTILLSREETLWTNCMAIYCSCNNLYF